MYLNIRSFGFFLSFTVNSTLHPLHHVIWSLMNTIWGGYGRFLFSHHSLQHMGTPCQITQLHHFHHLCHCYRLLCSFPSWFLCFVFLLFWLFVFFFALIFTCYGILCYFLFLCFIFLLVFI